MESPSRAGTSLYRRTAIAIAAPLVAAGCATPSVDAQWTDPQSTTSSLRGARVLVACDATEPVVKRLCEERLAEELTARGATPVAAPEVANPVPGRPVEPEQFADAARSAGATAILATTVSLSASDVSPGFSIGIGGFGGGRRVGGGVGISVPVGGGEVVSGYTANSRVTDVASGRLVWTARATTPPSNDLPAQVGRLARTTLQAAEKAGMF
jgi:hypothetical protein